jgi:hypothetical protein
MSLKSATTGSGRMDWLPGLFVRSEGRANVYNRKNVLPTCVAAVGFCAAPGVCTENLIRVDDVMKSPKLAE